MALAIFDLDNTLIAGDSDHGWGEFLVRRGKVEADHYRAMNDRFYADYEAGRLDIYAYLEFSLTYMAKIVDGLIKQADGRDVPVILFTKGGGLWLEAMANTGCDCLGLDWTIDIGSARHRVGDKVALQGNMDPAILRAKPEVIQREVKRILGSFGKNDGHVFNLGHGITPDIAPDNAKIFIDAVHEFSSSS